MHARQPRATPAGARLRPPPPRDHDAAALAAAGRAGWGVYDAYALTRPLINLPRPPLWDSVHFEGEGRGAARHGCGCSCGAPAHPGGTIAAAQQSPRAGGRRGGARLPGGTARTPAGTSRPPPPRPEVVLPLVRSRGLPRAEPLHAQPHLRTIKAGEGARCSSQTASAVGCWPGKARAPGAGRAGGGHEPAPALWKRMRLPCWPHAARVPSPHPAHMPQQAAARRRCASLADLSPLAVERISYAACCQPQVDSNTSFTSLRT